MAEHLRILERNVVLRREGPDRSLRAMSAEPLTRTPRLQRALRMRSSSSRISSTAPTVIALSATLNDGK